MKKVFLTNYKLIFFSILILMSLILCPDSRLTRSIYGEDGSYHRTDYFQSIQMDPNNILMKIRQGDREILRKVSYPDMLRVFEIIEMQARYRRIEEEAIYLDRYIRALLVSPGSMGSRQLVLEATSGGLYNPDPRVRLMCINILRRLVPYYGTIEAAALILQEIQEEPETFSEYEQSEFFEMLARIEQTIADEQVISDGEIVLNYETVILDFYSYMNINTSQQTENDFIELNKLMQFISRKYLIENMLSGSNDFFVNINTNQFYILSEQIDEEGFCKIPLNFIGPEYLEMLFTGLFQNPDEEIHAGILKAILRIIRTVNIPEYLRISIYDLLLESGYQEEIIIGIDQETLSEIPAMAVINAFTEKNGEVYTCYQDQEEYEYNDRYDQPDSSGYMPPSLVTVPLVFMPHIDEEENIPENHTRGMDNDEPPDIPDIENLPDNTNPDWQWEDINRIR